MKRALAATRAALAWALLTASLATAAVVLAPTAEAATTTYTANTSVNIRTGPSTSQTILTQLQDGQSVVAAGAVSGNWLPITYDNTTAYVWAAYLDKDAKTASLVLSGPAGRRTALENVNIRATASLHADITVILDKCTEITVTGFSSGKFAQVSVDGSTAWLYDQFLSTATDTTPAVVARYTTTTRLALRSTASVAATNQITIAKGDTIGGTTFGSALTLAGTRAMLEEVASEAAYARIERLGLRGRAWVSALDGTLHVPSELIFPEPLAHALLGDDGRFPDPAVAAALDAPTADRLGLQRATSLSLAQVATAHENREAPRALLEWLEAGLEARRFTAAEVRERFATLRLRDDEGTLRTPAALLRRGGRALFGSRRGDWSASSELPRLARALGIPNAPDDATIVAFLAEVGDELSRGAPPDHDTLLRVLPECLARLRDVDVALVEGIAVVGRSGATLRLVRVGEPSLRLGSPASLADALPRDVVLELLPLDREPSLDTRLLAAGVPDLWSELEIARVMSGARRNDPRTEALARRVGAEVANLEYFEGVLYVFERGFEGTLIAVEGDRVRWRAAISDYFLT